MIEWRWDGPPPGKCWTSSRFLLADGDIQKPNLGVKHSGQRTICVPSEIFQFINPFQVLDEDVAGWRKQKLVNYPVNYPFFRKFSPPLTCRIWYMLNPNGESLSISRNPVLNQGHVLGWGKASGDPFPAWRVQTEIMESGGEIQVMIQGRGKYLTVQLPAVDNLLIDKH